MRQKTKTFQINSSKVPVATPDSLISERLIKRFGVIPFGSDNLFPQAIAALNRKSGVHRGILNKKMNFIGGHGFRTEDENLFEWTKNVNSSGQSLTEVLRNLILDRLSDGNAYLEFITNSNNEFLNLEHHDHTTVRISEDKLGFVIKANWRDKRSLPEYLPKFPYVSDANSDGIIRTMVHIKSYEPEFVNYGIMDWVAGLDASAIAYKTNRWNIARLDNSFQSSGIMMVSGEFESEEASLELKNELEAEYSGEDMQGKVVFIVSDLDGKQSKFIPIEQKFEGDWHKMSEEAIRELISAHSWYRSLMSLGDSNGFDKDKILNEYNMALLDTILPEQNLMLSPIKLALNTILGIDATNLTFINKSPVKSELDKFLKVWEARAERGLPYDEEDEMQKKFLFEVM
jgi:hypothetical protein